MAEHDGVHQRGQLLLQRRQQQGQDKRVRATDHACCDTNCTFVPTTTTSETARGAKDEAMLFEEQGSER